MNNLIISLIGIVVFTSIVSLLAKFFDIGAMYYVPFMMWIIAVLIFNMFLDKNINNVFMQEISIF